MVKDKKIKRVAILASGGNSPAMNNVVITMIRKCRYYGVEILLVNNGYYGLLNEDFTKPDLSSLSYFYATGNIFIGSSRFPKFKEYEYQQKAVRILKNHKIDCLFVVGGDGSYRGAADLKKLGVRVICFPGTIDNDVASTERTIGFSTALNNIINNIDAVRNCFDSHLGVCLVEVMGRRFPDLAINAGIACQAEEIITVDNILTTKQIIDITKQTWKNKHRSCLIVVTEKIYGRDGLPTLKEVADAVEKATNRISRVCVLGYTQRGGIPTAEDRNLAIAMADYGLDLALNKPNGSYAIGLNNNRITHIEIEKAVNMDAKTINSEILRKFNRYNKI